MNNSLKKPEYRTKLIPEQMIRRIFLILTPFLILLFISPDPGHPVTIEKYRCRVEKVKFGRVMLTDMANPKAFQGKWFVFPEKGARSMTSFAMKAFHRRLPVDVGIYYVGDTPICHFIYITP